MKDISEIDRLFGQEVKQLAREIAQELANRNLSPLSHFHFFVKSKPEREFTVKCTLLNSLVESIVRKQDLAALENKPSWLAMALEYVQGGSAKYDPAKLAYYICVGLLDLYHTEIDEHIENLTNTYIYDQFGVTPSDNMLVNLSDERFALKRSGIIFDNRYVVYPHQFMRRYYSANFVGIPPLLMRAKTNGLEVSVRLDPLRLTDSENYRDGPIEADHWYGPPFSQKILDSKYLNDKTLHGSRGLFELAYHVEFTLFRTKMMDKNLREFMIEEYCPMQLPYGQKAPGIGEVNCIQKFAHLVYDQEKKCFVHLDGAVRVYPIDEYQRYFNAQGASSDKAGKRHKMFLIEGQINTKEAQELLTEWFRYNPHIEEYFTGSTIEPFMTYEQFEEIKAKRN